MSLQVWLPLNQGPENVITDISNFGKESGISITADTNGWYKIADSSHTSSSSRWGIYKDFYVKSNTTYTLNVYAKSTTGVTANVGIQSFNGYTGWPTQRETYSGSSEKLITFTWTTAATDNYARVYLAMNPSGTVANNYVFYKGVEVLEAPEIKNQGLDTIAVITNNTNNFQEEGKISNTSLDVSGHYAFRVPSLVKKRVFSCAFWYKPITDSSLSDNWRKIIVFDTYTSDGSTTGAIFRFESSYGYQSSSTTYCISIHNNVGEPIASIGTGLGEIDGWNKWHHIAITADGTTLRCYRNGIQVATGNMNNGGMLQGIVHIGYSGNRPIGRLNDFRLYDNCLSPKEVKEISQGLLLYYPLNRRGLGQENLDNFRSYTNNWTMESLSGSNYTDSTYGNVIKLTTSATNQRMYHSVISTLWQSGQVYTVSFLAKADVNGRTCNMSRSIADFSPTFTLTTDWKRYSGQITSTATPGGGTLSFRIIQSGATVYITQIKLEKGEIATPYCPGSTDPDYTIVGLNSTTEYDTSGFNNHGTRYGTFTWTKDTPKYRVSTHIGATNQKIHISNFPTSGFGDSYSFAWWGKRNSNSPMFWGFSDGIRLNGMYGGTLWNTGDSSNNPIYKPGTTTKITAPSIDVWHHYVMTGDGTTCKLYLDGELYGQAKTYKAISGTSIWINGWDSGTQYCSDNTDISDFRIYATALSASDVLELYNNKNF